MLSPWKLGLLVYFLGTIIYELNDGNETKNWLKQQFWSNGTNKEVKATTTRFRFLAAHNSSRWAGVNVHNANDMPVFDSRLFFAYGNHQFNLVLFLLLAPTENFTAIQNMT